jgi:hypothetical protein
VPTHLFQDLRREAMAATRYSDRVQPGNSAVHPIAAAVARFAGNQEGMTDREWLAAAAGYFLESFQFVDTRGPVPIEETVRSRRGNCLALSCLLASALKHLGVLKGGVAVFAGCRLLQPERLHAYVLTHGEKPGELTLVDPQFMKPMNLSLQGFWERHRVYVLFDDSQETTSNDAMRAWLANLARASAYQEPSSGAGMNPGPAGLSRADSTKEDSALAKDGPHVMASPDGKALQRIEWIVYGTPAAVCGEIAKQLRANSGDGPSERRSLGIMDRLNLSSERLDALDPQWRTKVAVVPEKVARQLARLAHKSSQTYSRVIAAEMVRLEGLARHFRREERRCSWDELSHIVTAGMVIDMGLRDQLLHLGLIEQQPIDFWMWIFEGGTGATHGFGVRLRGSNQEEGTFHELWHSSTRRPHPLKIDLADIALLRSLARPGGRAANDLNVEEQKQALKLSFFHLCSRRDGRYILNLPVLAAPDGEAVRAEVRRICGDIMTGTVRRAMEEAAQIYSSEFSSSVADIFKHAFARVLMEHAMDRVLEHKLIGPFPSTADFNWGCWLSWTADE